MSHSEVCAPAQTSSHVGQIRLLTSCSLPGASSDAGPAAAGDLKRPMRGSLTVELVLRLTLRTATNYIYWCFSHRQIGKKKHNLIQRKKNPKNSVFTPSLPSTRLNLICKKRRIIFTSAGGSDAQEDGSFQRPPDKKQNRNQEAFRLV